MREEFTDFSLFAENNLTIINKNGRQIPFKLNSYQRRICDEIKKQEEAGQPVRIFILKARQMGISTFCAGYIYFKTTTNPFISSATVAHDSKSSANIFSISKRFYEFTQPFKRPMKRYSNAKELTFENPDEKDRDADPGLLSKMWIETAGKKTAGRSATIHHLHISELAYWEDAKETLTGLLESVPHSAHTSILIESTANGVDGIGREFYEWFLATSQAKNSFKLIFIPWFENNE